MKILHVMAGAQHGGAETAFIDMCVAMAEAGHDVAAVTRENPRNERLLKVGIPVYTARFGGAIDIFTPRAIVAAARVFHPQIIQTWMSRASARTPAWRRSYNVPPYKVVSRLGGYYDFKYFRSADAFVTITPMIREYLIRCGVHPDRVRHINNFAETEENPFPVDRAAEGVSQKATLLLCLSRLHEGKGLDLVIKAVADLQDAYLWIAGEGPERAALEALIASLGVQDRVRLLGWREDRAALLQAADICVFFSRYEPFGTVFVQAWAQGTPLIVSDADGPRQFVRDGEDGLIVPVGDIDALRNSIVRLRQEPSLGAAMVHAGRLRYEQEFTKAQSVRQYIDFYEEILKAP